jgi:cystathionine beta-lyase
VLGSNRDALYSFARTHLAGLDMKWMESTYLAWMDARPLGQKDPAAFFRGHGVVLSDGADFGAPGHVRFNFGCPRAQMDEGLERMAAAIRSLA